MTNINLRSSLWRGRKIGLLGGSFNPAHRLIEQTVEATVGHNVREEADAKTDARELFGTLQLPDPDNIGDRYPHQVSGGQLQRVMTAMAMSPRPASFVCSE